MFLLNTSTSHSWSRFIEFENRPLDERYSFFEHLRKAGKAGGEFQAPFPRTNCDASVLSLDLVGLMARNAEAGGFGAGSGAGIMATGGGGGDGELFADDEMESTADHVGARFGAGAADAEEEEDD